MHKRQRVEDHSGNGLLTACGLLLLCLATSCAQVGTQTATTTPAPQALVENEQTLPTPSDATWDRLVRQLSKGFYVINNIDKASRLINFSFSSDSPQDYVDCGTTHRTYDRGDEHQQYDYQVAQSSSFKMGGKRNNQIITWAVNRTTGLEGRANVYVAPKDTANTTVSVNVRYILTVKVTGTYESESLLGTLNGTGPMTPESFTATFSTNDPHATNMGTPDSPQYVTCRSRGTLEREILSFAKGN